MMAEDELSNDIMADDVEFRVGGTHDGDLFCPNGKVLAPLLLDDEEFDKTGGGTENEETPLQAKRETHVYGPTTYQMYHSTDEDVTSSGEEDAFRDSFPSDLTNKPLMPPRQRPVVRIKTQRSQTTLCAQLLWPLVYLTIFVAAMAAFVCLVMYVVDVYTTRLLLAEQSGGDDGDAWSRDLENLTVIGCGSVAVKDVWVVGLPKILTESAFRLVDVNQDGVLDVIFGFATGADKMKSDDLVCDIYFNGTKPCGGGILALDGVTGSTLWEHRAVHEIFSLNCQEDLNQDGIKDCIGGGRAGTFQAASGRDGALLWRFNDSSQNMVMNAYTGQYVGDMDDDGIPDILNIHGGDPLGEPGSATRLVGRLMLFSGRTGSVLNWFPVPEPRESYYSPVLYRRRDGTDYVLFGTGGETHPGALWLITLRDLRRGQIAKAIRLYRDAYKGIMTPPVLVDLTHDGTEDIVFATFNSTVIALDGETYGTLWSFSYNSSETYATPAAGFFNDDDVPDFLVRWQTGPGFPLYYYSIMTILDGVTGLPLVTPYPRDSIGAQASPLTVSVEGSGNDVFLYWISDCHGQNGTDNPFSFIKGTNVHEQSRADFCRLRFKSAGFSKLLAVSTQISAPGQTIYNSEERYHVERSAWVNTTVLAREFLRTHPDRMQDYREWKAWVAQQQNKWRLMDKARKSDSRGKSTASGYGGNGHKYKGRIDSIRQRYEPTAGNLDRTQGSDKHDADLQQEITSIVSELLKHADRLEEADDYDQNKDGGVDVGGNRQGVNKRFPAGEDFQYQASGGRKRIPSRGYEPSERKRNHGGGSTYPGRNSDGVSLRGELLREMSNVRDSLGWEGGLRPGESGPLRQRGWQPQTQGASRQSTWEDRLLDSSYNTDASAPWQAGLRGSQAVSEEFRPVQDWQGQPQETRDMPQERPRGNDASKRILNPAQWQRSRIQKPKSNGDRPQQKKTGRGVDEAEAKVRLQELHAKYMDSFGRKKRLQKEDHVRRRKRHVGPHDEGGLQRLISTGTLAPPLLSVTDPDYARSMDVIFATYWFYPAKTTILFPEDEACVKLKMDAEANRFDPNSDYYGMDHDAYEHAVMHECLEQSGHVVDKGTYESQSTFNPYNLHMGQMTVYRLRLKCQCADETKLRKQGKRCAEFLPHAKQQWAAYMGSRGDSHWVPGHRTSTGHRAPAGHKTPTDPPTPTASPGKDS